MKLDVTLPPVGLRDVPAIAKAAEEIGFDALWTQETQHDPFLPCALIAEHSTGLRFGTAIAAGSTAGGFTSSAISGAPRTVLAAGPATRADRDCTLEAFFETGKLVGPFLGFLRRRTGVDSHRSRG